MKIDSTWYQFNPALPFHEAAGGVVARWENKQVWIALVREGNFPDYILPKGRLDPGEDAQTAARREIAEEAGLGDLRFLGLLEVCERMNVKKTAWKRIHYFLYVSEGTDGQPTDPHHIYHCEWFPLDELPSLFWPEQRKLLEDHYEKIKSLVMPRL